MAIATPSLTTAATTTASKGNTSGTTSAADQQDRFMKLLVAQMKNQDPLNPMDNAQMTSQVAQINTVAGIEKLNTTVQGLAGAFAALQAQQAATLPGRSVLVAGNALALSGGQARGGVELAARADAVTAEVVAGDGRVVRTLNLGAMDAGVRAIAWDGKDASGAAAPDGSYRLRIAATAGGQPVGATALTAARVQSVVPSASGVTLDLGAAGTQAWSDVKSFL